MRWFFFQIIFFIVCIDKQLTNLWILLSACRNRENLISKKQDKSRIGQRHHFDSALHCYMLLKFHVYRNERTQWKEQQNTMPFSIHRNCELFSKFCFWTTTNWYWRWFSIYFFYSFLVLPFSRLMEITRTRMESTGTGYLHINMYACSAKTI